MQRPPRARRKDKFPFDLKILCVRCVRFPAIIPLLSRALLTEAVEDDFVIRDAESGRSQFLESLHAFLKIKDALAVLTMKVVMMPLLRTLVTGRLSGNLDGANLPLGHEVFQRAIDGCNADRGDDLQGKVMDLIRQQGAILRLEHGLDGLFLSCGASLDRQETRMLPGRCYFKPVTMVETLCLIMES